MGNWEEGNQLEGVIICIRISTLSFSPFKVRYSCSTTQELR